MRSSALVFVRAVVMLAFLVALPVFAIFGAAPWEAVRGFILPAPAEEPLPEAPPFHPLANSPRRADSPAVASLTPGEPVSPSNVPQTLPRGNETVQEPARPEFERPLPSPPSYQTEPPPWRTPQTAPPLATQPPAQPQQPQHQPAAGGYESTPFPAPEAQRFVRPEEPQRAPLAERRPNVDPAVQPASIDWPPASAGVVPANGDRPAPAAPPGAGDFQAVQQRLQALGATYYRLETWGQKNQFRFHCRMAVRENTHFARQFEATDADPVLAMRKVLEQVERWRAEHPLQP